MSSRHPNPTPSIRTSFPKMKFLPRGRSQRRTSISKNEIPDLEAHPCWNQDRQTQTTHSNKKTKSNILRHNLTCCERFNSIFMHHPDLPEPKSSQEAPKEAPRATKRPTRWDKKVPRELQEASRAEIIEKPPYCQHFFIKSLKTTILSAFSRTGRAVGAQPGATKKYSKRTRPHRGWDTSGVQNIVFMNIDPHRTL